MMPASHAPSRPSNLRRFAPILILLLAAIFLWLLRGKIHFDWKTLFHEFRYVALSHVLLAVACIYSGYWFRAMRWSVLLAPVRQTRAILLLPAQLIGFTIAGLFGRVADLSRPYLIARRLHTPVASQLAIYSIERAFDLAAAAILFSLTLAFAPRSTPHHEAFARAGAVSLAATLLLAGFAFALRLAGDRIAEFATRMLRPVSERFASTIAARLLEFREGLQAISTLRELFSALALSLALWIGIALTYLECAHAFWAAPQLATFTIPATMLLLATSMGGSLLQLPVLGWFTQIALMAAALHGFFAVPLETATACAVVMLFATSLSVLPAGLWAARVQGIALGDAARSATASSSVVPS